MKKLRKIIKVVIIVVVSSILVWLYLVALFMDGNYPTRGIIFYPYYDYHTENWTIDISNLSKNVSLKDLKNSTFQIIISIPELQKNFTFDFNLSEDGNKINVFKGYYYRYKIPQEEIRNDYWYKFVVIFSINSTNKTISNFKLFGDTNMVYGTFKFIKYNPYIFISERMIFSLDNLNIPNIQLKKDGTYILLIGKGGIFITRYMTVE